MTVIESIDALEAPSDSESILRNVRRILPIVDDEAAESNARTSMTERMGDALKAAGVYRVGFSRTRGGPEMSIVDQTRMVEMIAVRDASTAWNATVLAATGFYACRLPDDGFAELYPEFDLPTCGSFHPKGRAIPVDGGYRVTGDWNFGSGIRSAHHIVGGVEVFDAAGEPVRKDDGSVLTLGVWLPFAHVKVKDDWQTIGLRGSGSHGYSVTDVFVPQSHSFDRFFAPTPDTDPLNKHVDLPFYSMAGISIGIAQHALDFTTAELARRTGTRAPGERVFGLLGEAATYVRAARSLVYDAHASIDAAIFNDGDVPTPRVLSRGVAPLATEFARKVIDICQDLLGSRTIYERFEFELLIRDLVGVSAHASTWRSRWVDVGRTEIEELRGVSGG